MFVGEIMERNAAVLADGLYAKCPFFPAFTRHYLCPERNLHFGACPNLCLNRCFGLRLLAKNRHPVVLVSAFSCASSFAGLGGSLLPVSLRRISATAGRSVCGSIRRSFRPVSFSSTRSCPSIVPEIDFLELANKTWHQAL